MVRAISSRSRADSARTQARHSPNRARMAARSSTWETCSRFFSTPRKRERERRPPGESTATVSLSMETIFWSSAICCWLHSLLRWPCSTSKARIPRTVSSARAGEGSASSAARASRACSWKWAKPGWPEEKTSCSIPSRSCTARPHGDAGASAASSAASGRGPERPSRYFRIEIKVAPLVLGLRLSYRRKAAKPGKTWRGPRGCRGSCILSPNR